MSDDDASAPETRQPGQEAGSMAEARDPDLGVAQHARAGVASGAGVAESLRALVGQRDKGATDLAFALNALSAIGVSLAPDIRSLGTGAELLALADERQALATAAPLPGDLVLFDRADGTTPASLVGVVVGVAIAPERRGSASDATVEFVYLARGVVRRGYVTPATPAVQRDSEGRARNTFVRPLTGKDKKSDDFLAGQLFRAYIRVDRLPQ